MTVEDERFSYGEQRFVTFGLLQGRVVAIVHTEREEYTRIISARKATLAFTIVMRYSNNNEQTSYEYLF